MADQRSVLQDMLSDNAGNFAAADKELNKLYHNLIKRDRRKVLQIMVKWSFIPSTALHFGGVHETMIKPAKKLFKLFYLKLT